MSINEANLTTVNINDVAEGTPFAVFVKDGKELAIPLLDSGGVMNSISINDNWVDIAEADLKEGTPAIAIKQDDKTYVLPVRTFDEGNVIANKEYIAGEEVEPITGWLWIEWHKPRTFAIGRNNYGQLGVGDTEEHTSWVECLNWCPFPGSRLASVFIDAPCFADPESFWDFWVAGNSAVCGSGDLGYGSSTSTSVPVCVGYGWSYVTGGGDTDNSFIGLKGGRAYSWGYNYSLVLGYPIENEVGHIYKPKLIPDLSEVKFKAAYCYSSVGAALTSYGKLYTWGRGNFGTLGRGEEHKSTGELPGLVPLSGVKKFAMGNQFCIAIASGGVYVWGADGVGSLGLPEDDEDYGKKVYSPKKLSNFARAKDVAASENCCFVLDYDGKLYAWGANEDGEHGTDSPGMTFIPPTEIVPKDIPEGDSYRWTYITARGTTVIAKLEHFGHTYVYGWGDNTYGQLGLGHTDTVYEPTRLMESDDYFCIGYQNVFRYTGWHAYLRSRA